MVSVRIGAALWLLFVASVCAVTVDFEDIYYNGTVLPETKSRYGQFDGPKLSGTANATTYDWWYFDAVSASSNQSVTFVFYNSGPEGFFNSHHSGPYAATVSGSFANGTVFYLSIDSVGGARLTYSKSDNNIHGQWLGADNVTFIGTNLTDYLITIDAPGIGVSGTVSFHSQCATEAMIPHVWWSNAVPDAVALVDLVIDGEPLVFSDGIGYHDKNWGDTTFVKQVYSWYWGHARVGPYSIVWFDAIDAKGDEYASGYISSIEYGAVSVLASNCSTSAVSVRPWGKNSAFPPKSTTGIAEGLEATVQLSDGSLFVANITIGLDLIDLGFYIRTLASVTGGIVGGPTYDDGHASLEIFQLARRLWSAMSLLALCAN